MITASQIAPLRGQASDAAKTDQLKADLARLRSERDPLYLTVDEFDRILRWKLRQQIGRQRIRRSVNTDVVIRSVTGLALTITHDDPDYQTELRIGVLRSLRGVDVAVASAFLALSFPEDYAVVDFRGWRQVFDEDRRTFSISDYKRYLWEIRRLARELGWPAQEVDLAIWEYDRRNGYPTSTT